MKSLLTTLGIVLALGLSTAVRAETAEEEKEIKGEGLCLKCELKKADKCTNAIRVKKDGKETIYVLEDNAVSKAFHKNVCSAVVKVTAKGKVKKDGDKNILVAAKIEKDEKQ
ncbi:MAG: DUF6370 family protein [Limisphaerales bacterium]